MYRNSNLYSILGIDRTAESEEIKSAYRRLAKLHHPDCNSKPGSEKRMQDINWAYAILRDPVQRAQYNQWLAMRRTAPPDPRHPQSAHRRSNPHNAWAPYPWPHRNHHPRRSSPSRPTRRATHFSSASFIQAGSQSWLWALILIAGFRTCSIAGSLLDSRAARTLTADLSSAARATAQAASQWPLSMFDGFEASNPNDWKIGSYAYERATIDSRMDGSYRWHARAESHFVVWGHPNQLNGWETSEAFYLSVDYRQITGPETAVAGLVFRSSGSEMNVFRVRGDQSYAISHLQEGAKGWDELVPWTHTTAICPGEVNRLVVMGDGAHFIFLINGYFVGEFEDQRLSSGIAGLAIELFEPGDLAIFEFDNLELRHPMAADVQASGRAAPANAISP